FGDCTTPQSAFCRGERVHASGQRDAVEFPPLISEGRPVVRNALAKRTCSSNTLRFAPSSMGRPQAAECHHCSQHESRGCLAHKASSFSPGCCSKEVPVT